MGGGVVGRGRAVVASDLGADPEIWLKTTGPAVGSLAEGELWPSCIRLGSSACILIRQDGEERAPAML